MALNFSPKLGFIIKFTKQILLYNSTIPSYKNNAVDSSSHKQYKKQMVHFIFILKADNFAGITFYTK
jgi:hypothetical protein